MTTLWGHRRHSRDGRKLITLRAKLNRAFAEIRKQVFATRVVFDREIVEEAHRANGPSCKRSA